ncbi:3-oxoacyl-ACP synthase III family protein [Mycobacterium decipiens]|uniref:3-oxoacyl-ACP synthase n=1 Tax=Mycobacterium decipiens TaxID=1430326 RepID=A0A1X2M013_9MYCO|nr:3-oxoacyl-[acyl-carrier-protein] synthase III C-terminal domain-containing protein [Mycobacterium decipiens]OSC42948.1 hypothetical protein B8W66_00570 [Mycobacterium decipiens]
MTRPRILAPHISLPATVRNNDYYRQHYPKLVADSENSALSTVWTPDNSHELTHFERAMTAYVTDPFRGTVHRHTLAPDETIRTHEIAAATAALADGAIAPDQVDLLISVSMWPDQLGFGNGLWLAEQLGLRCAAWNLETAQSGGLAALQAAHAFTASGLHKTVLVVVSCSYSRAVPESSTFAWFLGDAAAAAVVTTEFGNRAGGELLSAAAINTVESQHEFIATPTDTPYGPNLELTPSTARGSTLRKYTDYHLSSVIDQAANRAGYQLSDIDFFVFSTPVAWFTDFTTQLLSIDPAKTINTYPQYANIGPALPLVNLHEALNAGHIQPGAIVLIATIGSVSSAAASLLRWN